MGASRWLVDHPSCYPKPFLTDHYPNQTQTNAYTVSKLPALPDRLRADIQSKIAMRPTLTPSRLGTASLNIFEGRQHGAVYSSTGYALTLTHTHAYVWPYTSTIPSPETFTFTLPYPSKHASDPLPLGSLVSPSTSSEDPGLVVVMPLSGKIVYWESISSAATLDFLRQQRSGVEDTISGMFSGEHVAQIVNAESAGFILVLSSGRLAYMNVRDTHGRPGISVQFLRNGLSSNASGFLGSLRHALSSPAIRGDIAAARASQSTVIGERVVVAATSKGRLSSWQIHRGGRHELLADEDVREKLARAMEQAYPAPEAPSQDSLVVVDFAFVPRGLEKKYVDMSRLSQALSYEQEELQHLLLLVMFAGKRQSRYALVEVVISAREVDIGMVRPLTSYTTPTNPSAPSKPRIYLPRPGLVAFIIFDRAVVIASMASPPDSPDSQLQEDSHIIPATFEDVIDFQDEENMHIVGSGFEEPAGTGVVHEDLRAHRHRNKNPTAVLLLQGVGAIRVAVTDVDRFASEKPPEVTAKSKLEQAVFFGIKADNPLVFQGRRHLPFSAKVIGEAAIELAHEILSSKTPFIVNLPASLESNMRTRMNYLNRLIMFLNAADIALDPRTRWMLLYHAEKMAVATWIWQRHEQFLGERAVGDKKTIVSETAVYIHEHQKTEPNPAVGEVDPVRHWFLHDVWKLDIFLAWPYQVIKLIWGQKQMEEEGLNRLVWEAVTINNGAMNEVYEYRLNNCQLYGIDPKRVEGNDAASEPWTSSQLVTNNLKRMVELCHHWLPLYYFREDSPVNPELLGFIRDALPSLTNRYFSALNEYSEWALHCDDIRVQKLGKACSATYEQDRHQKILKLTDYGLWDEAIQLAKQHLAFESLAEVVVQQILTLEQEAAAAVPSKAEQLARVDTKKQQMGRLFDEYQAEFAFHAYEVLLRSSGVQAVLEFPYDKNGFATSFLRTKPELAKISWINDVEREKDINHAAETLLDLGCTREQQVWNKKIELSLGKLALLAEEPEPSVHSDSVANGYPESETKHGVNLEKIDRELALIKIQDDLYSQILPSIQEAVDESAELELALKEHGVLIPKKQKALSQVFEDGLSRLLKHEVLQPFTLIDVLTLANLPLSHIDKIGDQFFLALKVAKLGLRGGDRTNAEWLIWRRCLIRDDWSQVNVTNEKNDLDQLDVIGKTAAYRTMFAIVDERRFSSLSYATAAMDPAN